MNLALSAYDFDYYIQTPMMGSVEDQLTYTWTTDTGTVSGSNNATWTLSSGALGICKCQVVIDDVASVVSPDTGSRDDTPVTQVFQKSVPGCSLAFTQVSSVAAGITELRYAVSKYAATQQSLVLEYRENNTPYVTDWTAITATPEQVGSTTTDSRGIQTCVYKVMWNTLPLKNSHYEIRLRASYTLNCHNEVQDYQSNVYGVDIRNLDIYNSNPNYLQWAPGATQPTITTHVSDELNLLNTSVNISIYHSDRTNFPEPVRHATVSVNSSQQSSLARYDWDGNDDNGNVCPAGLYVYKITATHTQDGGTDTICDRSTTTLSNLITTNVTSSGDTHSTSVIGSSSGAISSGQLYIIDPTLNLRDNKTYEISQPLTNSAVTSYSFTPNRAGDYSILLTGNGSDQATDKSHVSRPILGNSTCQQVYGLSIYYNTVMSTPLASALLNALDGKPVNRGNNTGFYVAACGKVANNQYSVQSIPDPGNADVIKTTVAVGKPTGYVSGSATQTGKSPSIFVFEGHGASDHLECTGSTYITANDVDSFSTDKPGNSGGRLAFLLACSTAEPPTNFAQHLFLRDWNVIANGYISTQVTDTHFVEDFMPRWQNSGYSMDSTTINNIFIDTKASLINNFAQDYTTINSMVFYH